MSRVFVYIDVPDNPHNESILSYELLPGLSLKDLKGFVKTQTSIPEASQQFYLNDRPIREGDRTLANAGIRNGDLLFLREENSHLRQDDNQGRFDGIEKNLQFAYEHHPEVFGQVAMLYVPVLVNKHPLKAFVGTGAQTTFISPSCAKSCGVWQLMDRRYAGVARGLGSAQLFGRVHCIDLEIGEGRTYLSSLTIMEGDDFDLILGLDTLKRLQTKIDLRRNKLVFADGNEVDFLSEADSPTSDRQSKKSNAEPMQHPTPTVPNSSERRNRISPRPVQTSPTVSSNNPTRSMESPAVRNRPSTLASSSSDIQSSRTQARVLPTPNSGTRSDPVTSLPDRPSTPPPPYSLHPPNPTLPIRQRWTPASAQTNAQLAYSDNMIDQLTSLGFSRDEAIAALDACGGNVAQAAVLLWSR